MGREDDTKPTAGFRTSKSCSASFWFIAIYIPQYAQGSQETQEKIALAAEQIDSGGKRARRRYATRAGHNHPNEKYKDYGYHVRGNLQKAITAEPYVYLTFDEYGRLLRSLL